ncbi:MAG: hypothetical protein K2G70_00365 [Turicibacter sp.]|nr:hypothetical protein [Turicibacter sp.]
MKLKQFFLFGLSLSCMMLTVAHAPQIANAEEEKSETLYKTIQATHDIPYLPSNYQYTDWRERSIRFNEMLFNMTDYDLMFYHNGNKNTGRESLGVVTYTDEEREIESTQVLTLIGALLSAEKLNKESIGENQLNELVQFVESYYNIENGEGTLLNYQNIDSTELSFWQQIYPAITYFMLMDRYEATVDSEALLKNIADTWYEVVMNLGGADGIVDFGYTGYDFKNNKPFDNGEWIEPDAAAGVALLQYYAFKKFEDRKYIQAATLCMDYLDEFQRNPGYELLYLYLPYLSARLNAVEQYHFNTAKYMEFFFTESDYRHEYGIFNEDYAIGLIGERTQYGGTPYSFQSILGATALVPMLKYDQRYAVEVGRYLLQVTENLNLFYEEDDPVYENLVPLEKVQKNNETEERHSVLSGAYLGLLAAMIEPTNVEGILKVDINSSEYYTDKEKDDPLFLLFNPYDEAQTVHYQIQTEGMVSLYDLVSHSFIEENISSETDISIHANEAVIVLEIPIDEEDNQYNIDRKVEHSVTANVPIIANLVGLSRYETISDNYPIDLEIKTTDDAAVSNIMISLDGNPVFQNVTYTHPYVVEVEDLANGYHLLEVEVTTNTGVKDYSYARLFIQKDENPYILNENANDLAKWKLYQGGALDWLENYKKVVIGGENQSGIISEPFEIDFSQVPLLDLEVEEFTGTWSLILKDVETNQEFYLLENSTEAGHIILSMSYVLNKLNAGTFNLLGKHEIQLAIVGDDEESDVTINRVRIFNQGIESLKEKEWKSSFTTQKITHWQSRFNALARINYYEGMANIRNLNPNGNGGMQTSYFEVNLSKNPLFTIKVDDVDDLWSVLVYVESQDRGYYLQYPTDQTGTFTYNMKEVLEKVLTKDELETPLNVQFWIVSNGEYASEVKIDYLRLEYSKNWMELIAIGALILFSVTAICVNLNKDS